MERPIKFRAKTLDDGKWVKGDLFHGKPHTQIIQFPEILDEPLLFDVDSSTVGQYTGLKDRNGKEIYEGDIIRIDCHPWLDWKELDSVTAEIEFDDFMWSAKWKNPDAGRPYGSPDDEDIESEYVAELLGSLPNTIEVIGNIHDLIK